MSKVLRYGILAFVLAIFVSAISVTDAKAQLPEILARMDSYNKALNSLRSDVTMAKYDSVLKVTDVTYGNTSYLPKTSNGRYIRIDWTRPVEEQISVIGDKYELYRPRLNQVIQGKTNNAKNNASVGGALGFMSMSKDQLKANYKVQYLGDEKLSDGTDVWHLQLNPKTATTYKIAELWVDANGLPRQAKVTENNNDTTTVLLTNIQTNIKIKADIFRLNYPSTAKKIQA